LPELGAGASIDPLEALKAYLANREDLKDIEADLLLAAQSLLEGEAAA
jgi:exonuclease SbcD